MWKSYIILRHIKPAGQVPKMQGSLLPFSNLANKFSFYMHNTVALKIIWEFGSTLDILNCSVEDLLLSEFVTRMYRVKQLIMSALY